MELGNQRQVMTCNQNRDTNLVELLEEMHDGLASELGFIPGGNQGHVRSLNSMVELLLAGESPIEYEQPEETTDTETAQQQEDATKQEEVALEIEAEPTAGLDLKAESNESTDAQHVYDLLSMQQSASLDPVEVEIQNETESK